MNDFSGVFLQRSAGIRKRREECYTSLSSKFVVPLEAEPVLSQSDLRHSVSPSLVSETVRFLKVKMVVKGDG